MKDLQYYEDVVSTPYYYSKKLLENKEMDMFLLYNYGPFLIRHNKAFFGRTLPKIKNPDLHFMVSMYILKDTSGANIKDAKEDIHYVRENAWGSPYESIIYDFSTKILDHISKRSINTQPRSFESAILNYAPIVCYTQTLKNQELNVQDTLTNETLKEDAMLDNAIHHILKNNIIEILNNYDQFINKSNFIKMIEYSRIGHGEEGIASLYFVLVYLRYIGMERPGYTQLIKNMLNIYNSIEKIGRCEKIDVDGFVKSYESFIDSESSILDNLSIDDNFKRVLLL